jgi:hypothetical protein
MAHFAKIENNIVTAVIAVSNDNAPTESAGQAFIASLGIEGEWKQTSYNTEYVYDYVLDDSEPPKVISRTFVGSAHRLGGTPFRGKYAGIGDIYDAVNDVFVAPVIQEQPNEVV